MKKIISIALLCTFLLLIGHVIYFMKAPTSVMVPTKDEPAIEAKGDCNTKTSKMDCEVLAFIEAELPWVTEDSSANFCAYTLLGKQGSSMYLQAACGEYYVQDEKIVCPNSETQSQCFMSKGAKTQDCASCVTEKVEPYLAQGSGVSIPVIITNQNGGMSLWQPRDGALYSKDMEEFFPQDMRDALSEVDGGELQAIVVERAEAYFGVRVRFTVSGETGEVCTTYTDCGQLPFEYAARSNCPHTMKCLQNSCVAGCYDFSDQTRFPTLKDN
jgi:hypothetical protein